MIDETTAAPAVAIAVAAAARTFESKELGRILFLMPFGDAERGSNTDDDVSTFVGVTVDEGISVEGERMVGKRRG